MKSSQFSLQIKYKVKSDRMTRPLTSEEVDKCLQYLEDMIGSDKDAKNIWRRNLTFFAFSCLTGLRSGEVLNLKIKDIFKNGEVMQECYLKRSYTKGKVSGRRLFINDQCREYLKKFHDHYSLDCEDPERHLFVSARSGIKLDYRQIKYVYEEMFKTLDIDGKLGTHSCRKTFAKSVYNSVGRNILELQQALGHVSINSTQHYIKFDSEVLNNALKNVKI